jgi:hypothetical protein
MGGSIRYVGLNYRSLAIEYSKKPRKINGCRRYGRPKL